MEKSILNPGQYSIFGLNFPGKKNGSGRVKLDENESAPMKTGLMRHQRKKRTRTAGTGEVERFLEAWFAIRQVIQAANFNRFHQAGLSATQFMILNILPDNSGGMTISGLAAKTNLAPATMVKTVDSLEERGMVTRTRSKQDRRSVLVRITPEGTKLQNSAAGQFREHIASLFHSMPKGDRDALVTGLESLVRAASEVKN